MGRGAAGCKFTRRDALFLFGQALCVQARGRCKRVGVRVDICAGIGGVPVLCGALNRGPFVVGGERMNEREREDEKG